MNGFDVWAKLPDRSIRGAGWSRIAIGVTAEQAEVYVDTLVYQTHVEETQGSRRHKDA